MNYIFFYPAKNLGGVQLLFFRLARLLSGVGGGVSYVDFNDGYVAGRIAQDVLPITVVPYIPGELVEVPDGSVLVVPLSFIGVMSKVFRAGHGVKVLFWCLHPLNVPVHQVAIKVKKAFGRVAFYLFSQLSCQFYLKAKRSLCDASNSRGLYFMDSPNFDEVSKYFDLDVSEYFLPIFLDYKVVGNYSFSDAKTPLRRAAWLGRIDKDSKFFILKKIISDFLAVDGALPFLVVGDGAGRAMLEEYFIESKQRVIFLGEVPNEALDLILDDVDVVFAMGTSCLEAAARAKVVVKVDAFYEAVPDSYKYKIFSEIDGYDLGRVISENMEFSGMGMADLLEHIETVGVSVFGGRACHKYNSEYSVESFMSKFEFAVGQTCLSFTDALGFASWFDFVFYKVRGFYKKDKKII